MRFRQFRRPHIPQHSNPRVEFESDQQDHAVELYPDHQHDEGTDGAVYFVVIAEIVDVKGKAPGNENGKQHGQHGAWIEKWNLATRRGAILINHGKSRVEQQQHHHPAESEQGHTGDGICLDILKNKVEDDISQNDENDGRDQYECHQKGQLNGHDAFFEGRTAFERGGIIFFQAPHHGKHAVGSEPDGQEKTERQQPAPGNGGDVFDGFENQFARAARHDFMDGLAQHIVEIFIQRGIGQQGEQDDDGWENRHKKTECHTVRPGHDRIFFGLLVDERQ